MIMGKVDLAELISIWEYWTHGDPLLRQAAQEYGSTTDGHHAAADRILDRLTDLVHLENPGAATVAALSAGWAVLLALEHHHVADSPHWQLLQRDALRDHQEALALQPHSRRPGPALSISPSGRLFYAVVQ
jgi:hypothetical protein